jgi:hypothetical protein
VPWGTVSERQKEKERDFLRYIRRPSNESWTKTLQRPRSKSFCVMSVISLRILFTSSGRRSPRGESERSYHGNFIYLSATHHLSEQIPSVSHIVILKARLSRSSTPKHFVLGVYGRCLHLRLGKSLLSNAHDLDICFRHVGLTSEWIKSYWSCGLQETKLNGPVKMLLPPRYPLQARIRGKLGALDCSVGNWRGRVRFGWYLQHSQQSAKTARMAFTYRVQARPPQPSTDILVLRCELLSFILIVVHIARVR